jgi:membrane-associated protease RseP (regulator of RpoE activity)
MQSKINSQYCILIAAVLSIVSSLPATAQTGKKISGIGAQIAKQGNDPVISRLLPGGSAQKAGIPVGARIVSVDGKSVTGMSVEDVVKLIAGPAGSVVSLNVIEKQSVSRTYSFVRMEMTLMTLSEVPGTYVDPHNLAMAVSVERIADNQFRVSCPTQHWSGIGLASSYGGTTPSLPNKAALSAPSSNPLLNAPTFPPLSKGFQTAPAGSLSTSGSLEAAPDRPYYYIKGVYLMTDHPDVSERLRKQGAFFRIDLDYNNHLTLRTRLNFANDNSTTPELMMTEHILKKQ